MSLLTGQSSKFEILGQIGIWISLLAMKTIDNLIRPDKVNEDCFLNRMCCDCIRESVCLKMKWINSLDIINYNIYIDTVYTLRIRKWQDSTGCTGPSLLLINRLGPFISMAEVTQNSLYTSLMTSLKYYLRLF